MGKWMMYVFLGLVSSGFALEQGDREAIEKVVERYTDAWNLQGGKGFGDGYAENADFVNIFGMHFTGRENIESRHVKILETFLRGSKLKISDVELREIQPGVVIGWIHWNLEGAHPEKIKEGLYTHVFVKSAGKWEITAAQNTLISSLQ